MNTTNPPIDNRKQLNASRQLGLFESPIDTNQWHRTPENIQLAVLELAARMLTESITGTRGKEVANER